MDIEKVAFETPNKIITNKIDFKKDGPTRNEIEKISQFLNLITKQKNCIKIS